MTTRQGHTSTHKIHIVVSPRATDAESMRSHSLCGQPPGHPKSWPDGHLYAKLGPGGSIPPVVNCPECLQRHQKLMKGRQQ